ncbi:hypothetical protein DICPUDRAFT_149733 [Dictyostelium purpureum]|uniref:Transmembrane protein n=1 Tax=Dictyostelium purpureum TaxID=5786 RepID=F0ZEJ0_DICPU|nr:uncharacterized protein DICPUDRAFT_149733 [Dictyostelium purpureum]EGC37633.1 hypothetical protein DICPUDRAFT_149733 [Dictyostelium purpureum]|eukprot:XP_003285821.1 hypothetical protein DICPUDRAFT_149733 [Dictyostelium purpureum]
MISNLSKRFIINSNRIIKFSNNVPIKNNIININSTNNIFKTTNRFYSTNNKINNNNNNNDDNTPSKNDQNVEPFEAIYAAMLKKIDETEKSLNDDIKPVFKMKTKTQIILSRHGTLTFLLLCFTFLGTMIYFYFQKRKHTLLSTQVEYHRISTLAEIEKLKIDLSKLSSSLSNPTTQSQLVDLLIAEIIETNNEAILKLSQKEIDDLRVKIKVLILNYLKEEKEKEKKQ